MGARNPKGHKKSSKSLEIPERDPLPWERQSDESIASFEAFVIYRDMPERSCLEVSRILNKNARGIDRMRTINNWHERVVAWDNELDRRMRQTEIEAAKKMAARQIALSLGLQEAATLELQALVGRIKFVDANAKAANRVRQPITSVNDIIRLVETGTKLERLNRDLPESVTEERQTGKDGGDIGIAVTPGLTKERVQQIKRLVFGVTEEDEKKARKKK